MNKEIIKKAIIELRKAKPNKQYVLGMLETLVEMDGQPITKPVVVNTPSTVVNTPVNIPGDAIGLTTLKNPNIDPNDKSSKWK